MVIILQSAIIHLLPLCSHQFIHSDQMDTKGEQNTNQPSLKTLDIFVHQQLPSESWPMLQTDQQWKCPSVNEKQDESRLFLNYVYFYSYTKNSLP